MNRLKLWLYVLLLLGAGAGNLYFLTGWLTARSVAHIDRELRSAAAVADARIRLLSATAGSIADAAARAPAVVAAMADPAASALGPAEDAVQAAGGASMPEATRAALVAVAGQQGLSARAGGPEGKTVTAPEALLAEAQAGRRAHAWVKVDGTLWMIAAVPAGRNGGVAVGLPLDAGFAQALHGAAGVDVTATLDGVAIATTVQGPEADALAKMQAGTSRRPVDVGRLGKVHAALEWPAPPMPILFADPPAARALALPLDGAGAATLVVSQRAAPSFSGLAAYQVLALVAMALFLLVGVLLGLFMSEDAAPRLPRELVSAADRIARGDFSVRVPALAGSAGTIASALNRAAAAAQPAERASAHEPVAAAPVTAAPPRLPNPESAAPAAEAPVTEPETALADAAADPAVTQSLFPATGQDESGEMRSSADEAEPTPPPASQLDDAQEALPSVAAEPSETPSPHAEEARREGPAGATALELSDLALHDDEDEPHWRSVYADFVRLRSETGEPADALSYERFRARLERNREQLKDKHAARTVRFQPYLKEGKAALRATPVK